MLEVESFDIDIIIDSAAASHTNNILLNNNNEILKYYIHLSPGWNYLDLYYFQNSQYQIINNYIRTYSVGNSIIAKNFINEALKKLDEIIDLDFQISLTDNGSHIDIFAVNYSSTFLQENVVGQALQQKSSAGNWWEILWLENNNELSNFEKHTIIHELGHAFGLSHPDNKPEDPRWNTSITVMSYNKGEPDWSDWYSKNDINALIKIWGREDDNGYFKLDALSSDYRFKKNNDQYFIKTAIGEENITNLNEIRFTDKILSVQNDIINIFDMNKNIDNITGKIYRLYSAAFGRFPDSDGYNYWVEKNISGENNYMQTCNSFLQSEEFLIKYGNNPSNQEYINALYNNILFREPDIAGSNYWLNQLEKGIESRARVLIGFSESNENKELFAEELGFI